MYVFCTQHHRTASKGDDLIVIFLEATSWCVRMTINVCLTEPQKGVRLNRERLEVSRVGPEGSRVGPEWVPTVSRASKKNPRRIASMEGSWMDWRDWGDWRDWRDWGERGLGDLRAGREWGERGQAKFTEANTRL